MSGADEEWVKAAMSDDTMVVELLVRLSRSPPSPQMPPPHMTTDAFQLRWSVRQRRSKPVSINTMKPACRASPTTPLSWSGGSGGVSCEPIPSKLSSTARSKGAMSNEKVISKRSRKKKTLAELKDEENSLITERRELKRELAALRKNLDIQRATNENLKRLKIELQPSLDRETILLPAAEESTSGQIELEPTADHPPHRNDILSTSNANATDSKVILPDLNIPFGEPFGVS